MSTTSLRQLEPTSSSEFDITDPERAVDIENKHRLVATLLRAKGCDALLIEQPETFAWFTSGADCTRAGSTERTAALFITPDARVIVTSNTDSAQIFEHGLPGMGFQLKERPWHEPRPELIDDLCRGRIVASDTGRARTRDVSAELGELRIRLTLLECERLRELGTHVAHAVEATARHCRPEQTEAEIAGELAHRLVKHQIVPERLQVWANGKAARFPHWSYGGSRPDRCCTISAVGRRGGLHVGATRSVSFGPPPGEFRDAYHRAMLVQATALYFSKPGWELFEVFNRIKRIYEKFGHADDWRLAEQGEVIGYRASEAPAGPDSDLSLSPRMSLFWHPAIGPAIVGDTMLVGEEMFELLTTMELWPRLTITVRDAALVRPGILVR